MQEGISLHEDLDECLFCGQPLTAHRKEQLNAHFGDSVTELQGDIDRLVEELSEAVEASKNFRDRIPSDGDLYSELAGELRAARSK